LASVNYRPQAIVLHGLHNHMLSIFDRIQICDRPAATGP